ncbi:MAG: hypothetical protein ACI31R_03690 [Bacilli bacterium]
MNYEQNNGFDNYNDNNYNNYNNNDNLNYSYNNPNMMNNNMGNMNNNNGKQPLSYHIKRFLIGFLLVAILIFILLWLFPTKQGIKDSLTESLQPLYDRIFQENIDTMKEVAIAYYTTDRLPKNEGDTKKLTLGEMLEMKLLLSIKDKNGDMCDPDDSYVEITKMDKEYKMKVNLSCGDEEDYIVVYLGCYNYCLNDICEKKETTTATKTKQQTVFQKVTNNIKKIVKSTPTKTKTQPAKYYCAKVNGKYYNDKGKVVSKSAYEKACKSTPPKYYCAVVNGKYYDNKGNQVSKSAYEEACNPKPTKYKYLYEKTVSVHHDKEYSNWSDWSSNIQYNPDNNNINWGKHEYEWNEKVGYNLKTTYVTDKSKPIWEKVVKQMGSYTQYACAEYEYFLDQTTNTTYITNSGGWQYQGTYVYSTVPSSSNTVKYVYAGMSYSDCGTVCDVSPKYKFAKYTRTATATNTTSSTESDLSVVCKKTVKKEIPIYLTVNEIVGYGVEKVQTKTYYYHKKTRTLIKDEYTEKERYTAWSYSKNDETLINQGYKYTGVYEKVES